MELEIDWERLESVDDFYDFFLPSISAQEWHGRNLNALRDSLITGGIVDAGPPFFITQKNCSKAPECIREFQEAVISIFTLSIIENGGQQIVQA